MSVTCMIHNLPIEEGCPAGRSHIDSFEHRELVFAPGDMIFREGSQTIGVYCLRAGRVALMKRCGSEGDVMTSIAEPPDLLGLPGIMIGHHYANSAVALGDVSVCFIPREVFLGMVQEHPDIIVRAMQQLGRRIDRTETETDG